ncbi:eukaryotic translation initiation factor NCBP-like [Asparagus officinalis]|uniref:eukaryotic translation initiation factor NCBP-like n=1 Tax=Asparagus officinalis TaxID=4686 RepID=UPI00098E711C|nr:eukaryotic translation initiation factor NCBP-like [Asparagus officinalis]
MRWMFEFRCYISVDTDELSAFNCERNVENKNILDNGEKWSVACVLRGTTMLGSDPWRINGGGGISREEGAREQIAYKHAADDRERQDRELKAGLHPLKNKFVFWYTRRTPGVRPQTSYEDNIKKIVEFSTVEGFWVCYCHLARPSTWPIPTDLHLFKDGIRPLWEDTANCNGGKWIIRFKKVVSGRFWEDLVSESGLSLFIHAQIKHFDILVFSCSFLPVTCMVFILGPFFGMAPE